MGSRPVAGPSVRLAARTGACSQGSRDISNQTRRRCSRSDPRCPGTGATHNPSRVALLLSAQRTGGGRVTPRLHARLRFPPLEPDREWASKSSLPHFSPIFIQTRALLAFCYFGRRGVEPSGAHRSKSLSRPCRPLLPFTIATWWVSLERAKVYNVQSSHASPRPHARLVPSASLSSSSLTCWRLRQLAFLFSFLHWLLLSSRQTQLPHIRAAGPVPSLLSTYPTLLRERPRLSIFFLRLPLSSRNDAYLFSCPSFASFGFGFGLSRCYP